MCCSSWVRKESDMTDCTDELTEYSVVCMYHIFFIHSSLERHLDCFQVLAIVNNASGNTGVHASFQIMFFFFPPDIYPGVRLLDHIAALFLAS